MPGTPAEQPSGDTAEAALWPPLPCGPCIPIMLGLASLAAFFLVTTAVLAERLLRRAQRPDPRQRAPTLVWRPGGELWIEPPNSARERSEDWYGSAVPLLLDRGLEPPPAAGAVWEAPHSAPSSLIPQMPPAMPACRSTFGGPQLWEETPTPTGLVSWMGPEPRADASGQQGTPQAWRPRPGSPEPDWSLQPRVTLEQISAFWKREGRSSVGF
ncbi:transmembrane protein C16orf54 homolog [Thomomys bottae]